jgi:transposase
VERLGTVEALAKTLGGRDPIEWAKAYIGELNAQAKEGNRKITAEFWANKQLPQNVQTLFNGGYLFLQSIYHGLGLDEICRQISERYRFQYDLSAILSRLIYTRVMYPSSKMSSLEASRTLIEQPEFELAHIYRALDVIAKESDFIQERVYKNSLHLMDRNTAVLYYDCTNYFFETEEEDELRRYGTSKEHRPNPIVQMGLFMDGSGIPLAMCINNGASNEQPTLKPIEDRIARDFSLSKFVVCTDAGLGSRDNRVMNNADGRAFVVTQSLKQMKDFLKAWALTPTGWHIPRSKVTYNLKEIDDTAANECTYYKERWMKENGLVQRLIVSYSPKYKAYQRAVRAKQIVRAERMVAAPGILKRKKQNDPSRFVTTEHCTKEGEIAKRCKVTLDQAAVAKEEMYDGFYGVCTNLEDDISTIIKVNKGRWEIEESFRILKSEFRARPVYLSDTDRIKAHFTTCFLSLLVYRILERKLGQKYTVENILQTLREMKFYELKDAGYIPAYPRTALTDALHDAFGFRTDTEIVLKKEMRGILKTTKAG